FLYRTDKWPSEAEARRHKRAPPPTWATKPRSGKWLTRCEVVRTPPSTSTSSWATGEDEPSHSRHRGPDRARHHLPRRLLPGPQSRPHARQSTAQRFRLGRRASSRPQAPAVRRAAHHGPERVPVNHSEIVSFLWGVADLIRDTFRRGHYQDVILPLTVLRRLDCVLADTKDTVLKRQAELKEIGRASCRESE